jgi:hypothetical protein
MSGPCFLPHGSPLAGIMLRTIAVHEMFPGRRRSSPSNPVKRVTVPCYAASERQAEMGLTSRSAGNSRFPAGRFA